MNTETISYAIVGTGMMGREHIANIAAIDGAEVIGISDPDPESLRLGMTEAGLPPNHCFDNYSDLVAHAQADTYVVASPNHTHAEVMKRILATDAHVLIEKPLGTTVKECDEILAAAEGRNGVVWMGLEYRYKPPIARLIEEVESGAAGEVKMVAIREHRFPFLAKVDNWNRFRRNTGGTLVEKCCHFFDLMRLITRSEPVRVMASGSQSVNHLDESYEGEVPDIIDNAYVIVEFESGARASLDLCMFAEASRNEQEISVVGESGKVEAFMPESLVRVGDRSSGEIREISAGDARVQYHGMHEGSTYIQHLELMKAIRAGTTPAVTLEDGRLSVAMGVAAQLSIAEGRAVMMGEVLGN
jgi:predicted dehydrogenase